MSPSHDVWRVSPSQISLLNLCERKFAFKYIERIPVPEQPGAALGTECHEQLETYLKGGALDFTRPRSAELVARTLPHFPPPGPPTESEHEFQGEYHGVPLLMKIDVFRPLEYDRAWIWDLKTSGRVLKYALTPEQLGTDPQGIMYGWAAFQKDPRADQVTAKWVYTDTKIVLVKPVEILWDRMGIDPAMGIHILPKAKRILTLIQNQTRANELEPNPDACDAFGGCPYRGLCNLSPFEKLFSDKGTSLKMPSEIDNFLAGIQTAPEPSPAPETPKDIINPPESKGVDVTFPTMQAPAAQAITINVAAPAPEPPQEKPKSPRGRKPKAAPTGQTKLIGTLYVGSTPNNFGDTLDLSEALDAAQKELGTHWSLIPMGEGKGRLNLAVEKYLRSLGQIEALAAPKNCPETDLLLGMLMANSDRHVIPYG